MIRIMIAAAALAALANASAGRAAMAAEAATVNAPVSNPAVRPKLLHVYADAKGETHLEEITVAAAAGELPLTGLRAISYQPNKVDWHHAPTPQFAINLTGYLQVEVSDGTRRRIGPGDLVFLDDTSGKGHITRLLSPVTALFIHPGPGFDVHRWARGEQKAGG